LSIEILAGNLKINPEEEKKSGCRKQAFSGSTQNLRGASGEQKTPNILSSCVLKQVSLDIQSYLLRFGVLGIC